MKLGVSTYSINPAILAGEFTLETAIAWLAEQGAECVELVPFSYKFEDESGNIDHALIKSAKAAAKQSGVELVNYSVLANLCIDDDDAFNAEIARVKHHVDIAAELELPRMRHDISAFRRPHGENSLRDFDRLLPRMIDAANQISGYAKAKGVMTMVENHGFFVNGCDRVERLLNGVSTGNYGLLLDTGNIACVDEDPAVAVGRLADRAQMIHLKDFYIRHRDPGDSTLFDCGGSWFRSMAGRYLRGSILAQGDLDMYEILGTLKKSGYDGCIAIEFEGMEECKYAARVSLDNARRIWSEV